MKYLKGNEIRKLWIDFFKNKNHYVLESVSLIPIDDKSLLWINSGVATLKPYFDGRKNPPALSMVNSQKSIRTNDIENVGLTARHHTLFEMLGNFSIGGYFKKEAIVYAWEFLTGKKWLALDPNKLYVTVYEEDVEAYKIWKDIIGLDEKRIIKGSKKTNFWDIGQGPCGPNTEIFYDRGIKYDPNNIGIDLLINDQENDRYLEVWNIVFSQYNNDGNGNYYDLPRKNIDTGAGLERLTSVMQETITNFETDLFLPIIKKCETMTESKYLSENFFIKEKKQEEINIAFKVISDHIRAVTFAIADGVFPSNKERGYIIRRLIRRAIVYGQKLNINKPFLYKLVSTVIKIMKDFYNYLIDKKLIIEEVIKNEEEKFYQTLNQGYNILNTLLKDHKFVSGEEAFKLFDTYGFPIELTLELAQNLGINVDLKMFNELLEKHKQKARKARKDFQAMNLQNQVLTSIDVKSKFVGYENEIVEKANIIYLFNENEILTSITDGDGYMILDQTPFYAEKGGQAADNGLISNNMMNGQVLDVQEGPNKQHIHYVNIEGTLKLNDTVKAEINCDKRYYTMKNHSGTHLLHAAIRQVLGTQAMQTGSYNDENYLRLDIAYNGVITAEKINEINNLVLKWIRQNDKREVIIYDYDSAIKMGAIAFFNEKYDSKVRVVKFGQYSIELCGGTHVEKTGDIEDLLITSFESKGSSVFRFSALTTNKTISKYLLEQVNNIKQNVKLLYDKFQLNNPLTNNDLKQQYDKIQNFISNRDNLEILKVEAQKFNELIKKIEKIKHQELVKTEVEKYKQLKVKKINDLHYLVAELNDVNNESLRILADYYRDNYKNIIVSFINQQKQNSTLLIALTPNLSKKNKSARELMKNVLTIFNGNGGGNDLIAQAKINNYCKLADLEKYLLKVIEQWTI